MIWDYFIYFAIASVVLWLAGALAAWKGRMVPALAATSIGLCVFLAYILVMWVTLERPPMRTMGETRLWYSFFLPLAGIIVYARWRYQWILSFSTILATVFIGINVFKPEIHTKAMMPALQSPWFAPHVIVYMFAYALFGAAALMAAYLLVKAHIGKPRHCLQMVKTIKKVCLLLLKSPFLPPRPQSPNPKSSISSTIWSM